MHFPNSSFYLTSNFESHNFLLDHCPIPNYCLKKVNLHNATITTIFLPFHSPWSRLIKRPYRRFKKKLMRLDAAVCFLDLIYFFLLRLRKGPTNKAEIKILKARIPAELLRLDYLGIKVVLLSSPVSTFLLRLLKI